MYPFFSEHKRLVQKWLKLSHIFTTWLLRIRGHEMDKRNFSKQQPYFIFAIHLHHILSFNKTYKHIHTLTSNKSSNWGLIRCSSDHIGVINLLTAQIFCFMGVGVFLDYNIGSFVSFWVSEMPHLHKHFGLSQEAHLRLSFLLSYRNSYSFLRTRGLKGGLKYYFLSLF